MDGSTTRYVAVGVDGSALAALAVDWAAAEAALRGCPLMIAHAWARAVDSVPGRAVPEPFEESQKAIDDLLMDARQHALARHPGLDVTTEILSDRPVPGLVRVSKDADLLVVGSRGLGRFLSLMLGSVSHALATYAEVPLAVVRPDEGGGLPDASRPVVVGVAPNEPREAVLEAFAEAERRGVGLEAVRSWMVPQAYPGHMAVTPAEEAERNREEGEELEDVLAAARAAHPDVRVMTSVGPAEPAIALVEASRRAGVLVVGARRRRGRLSMPLGPVTQRVLHHGFCPTIVVPV